MHTLLLGQNPPMPVILLMTSLHYREAHGRKDQYFPHHTEAVEVLERIIYPRSLEEASQVSCLLITSSVQGLTHLSW